MITINIHNNGKNQAITADSLKNSNAVELLMVLRDSVFPSFTNLFKDELLLRMVEEWLKIATGAKLITECDSIIVCNFEGTKCLFLEGSDDRFHVLFFRSRAVDYNLLRQHSLRVGYDYSDLEGKFLELQEFTTENVSDSLDVLRSVVSLSETAVESSMRLAEQYSQNTESSALRGAFDIRVHGVIQSLRKFGVRAFVNLLVVEQSSLTRGDFIRFYRCDTSESLPTRSPIFGTILKEGLPACDIGNRWTQGKSLIGELLPLGDLPDEVIQTDETERHIRLLQQSFVTEGKPSCVIIEISSDHIDGQTLEFIEEQVGIALDPSERKLTEALCKRSVLRDYHDVEQLQLLIKTSCAALDLSKLELGPVFGRASQSWATSLRATGELISEIDYGYQSDSNIQGLCDLFETFSSEQDSNLGQSAFDESDFEQSYHNMKALIAADPF